MPMIPKGEIYLSEDNLILQNDINTLHKWSVENKMKFHPFKCKVLLLTNQRNILHNSPIRVCLY